MEPQTLVDQPIPLISGGFTQSTGSNTDPVVTDSGAETPNLNVSQRFPVANVSQETISQSLNTETKRITADYTFEQLGALSIGAFQQGVSGEIKISPDGIAAKNINGDATFTLDGTTGDATFSGTVKAGDVEVIDGNGLISLSSFVSGSTGTLPSFTTTSANLTDIPGSSLVIPEVSRTVKILVFASAVVYADKQAVADFEGEIDISIILDNSFQIGPSMTMRGRTLTGAVGDQLANSDITTLATIGSANLGAGNHTVKLQMSATQIGAGNFKAGTLGSELSYMILGR